MVGWTREILAKKGCKGQGNGCDVKNKKMGGVWGDGSGGNIGSEDRLVVWCWVGGKCTFEYVNKSQKRVGEVGVVVVVV